MTIRTTFPAIAALALTAASSPAATFTDETAWRAGVGNVWSQDNFEDYSNPQSLTSIPALGLTLDALTNGALPTVRSVFSVGGQSQTGPNVLLNGPAFPGNGVMTLRPVSGLVYALGYWNVGGDDRTRLAFHRANGTTIESVDTAVGLPNNKGFQGLVSAEGAAYVTITPIAGNGWISIDDLQVAVPAPGAGGVLALAGVELLRRRR